MSFTTNTIVFTMILTAFHHVSQAQDGRNAKARAAGARGLRTMTVGPAGGKPAADFATVQAAVDAAPEAGAVIRIRPGVYREVVHVDKPNVQMRGKGGDASKVVVAFDNGASNTCGTSCSATMFVTGDGFVMEGMTVANEWSKTGKPRTQGVALSITADRAVLRRVRFLGAQDTLHASSKRCEAGAVCAVSRQLFEDCYVEGEVDFIFGNARAEFDRCEIHSIAHAAGGYLTAQSRNSEGEESGYLFRDCRLTAEPGVSHVFLGRPWRDYARVTFLNTEMGAHIAPEGWSEWHPGETERLKTVSYAEYGSTGPGGDVAGRTAYSRQLTKAEAAGLKGYLRGADGWEPEKVR